MKRCQWGPHRQHVPNKKKKSEKELPRLCDCPYRPAEEWDREMGHSLEPGECASCRQQSRYFKIHEQVPHDHS